MEEKNLETINQNSKKSYKNLIFSYCLFFIKLILGIVITTTIPLLFVVVLLMKEPQEIEIINKFINKKIVENNLLFDYKYNTAKIGIDKKFKLTYNIYNLEINYDDNFVVFPSITLKFKIKNLLRKIFLINEIKINELVGYVGYNQSNKKTKNLSIDIDELETKIYELIRYVHRENKVINSLSIINSSFYIFDKNSNSSNKIEIIDSKIKLSSKLNETVDINTKIKLKINDNKDFVNTAFNCSVNSNDFINCSLNLNNFKISSVDFIGLLDFKNNDIQDSLNSINGLFNLELNLNLSNYINFSNANFKLYSNTGSFFIKQVFGDKITYKNLSANGKIDSFDHIELNSVKISVISDKIMELKLKLDYYKNKNMKIDIDINNALVKDIRVFWPVFLDDLDIRKWVIEHINYGSIDNAFAYMNFKFIDNIFVLDSIKSEVIFTNTSIDYHKSFPAITEIDAKAIFTVNDMNVYVKKAKMANTTLTDAKVYLDFLDETSTIDVITKAEGNVYELFYFVDNQDQEKVKNLVTTYTDGYAFTKANIKIPIADPILKKTYIKIDSDIKNNNTFLFKNNSTLKVSLLKITDSNNFNANIDCKNSFINFPLFGFVKNKNEELKILLDIIVQNKRVLLSNIKPMTNHKIDFLGNGNIESGILNELNFDYVNYGSNKFSVLYTDKLDNNPDIFINIENLDLKKDFSKDEITKILTKENSKNNKKYYWLTTDIKFQINNITFNKLYIVKNTNVSASLNKGDLIKFELRNKINESDGFFINILNSTENNAKYKINIECTNLGTFLSNSSITNNLVYGNFYFDGVLDKKSKLTGKFLLKDEFHIITKNIKDAELFHYILNNKDISEKTKNDLKSKNMISFQKLKGDIKFSSGILDINNILINSSDIFGVGISGNGFMNITSGMIKLDGFIVPLEKLNKLLGFNKIPIINQILFSGKDKGLVTIDYYIYKKDYNSEFEFNIKKSNGINNITPINSMLRFLSIKKNDDDIEY